jgi:hypothetical protein
MKMKFAVSIAIAALTLTACSDGKKNDPLAQDTTLDRDLALANQDTASKPQLQDVPVAATPAPIVAEPQSAPAPRSVVRTPPVRVAKPPARVTTKPAPAPAIPAPTTRVTESGNTEKVIEADRGSEKALGVVSTGTEISLSAGQQVCTNTNSVGDRFTAQIANPVMGANGTVIPVGSTAVVEVTSLKKSEKSGDDIEVGLRVASISYGGKTYPVSSETTYAQVDRVREESRGDDAKKVVTGAAIGAVLGQILGHKTKSTVIGAGAGAAAGAVIANRNANYNGCVPTGGRITIRLTEPLTIQLTE